MTTTQAPGRERADRAEITELVSRLGLWLDEQRWDNARSVLTDDATAETLGGTASGLEAVVEQARRNHTKPGIGTQHVITGAVVEVDGDRATIGANLLVTFFERAEVTRPVYQLGERYGFEAVRTPAGWRLSRVRVTPLWRVGERP